MAIDLPKSSITLDMATKRAELHYATSTLVETLNLIAAELDRIRYVDVMPAPEEVLRVEVIYGDLANLITALGMKTRIALIKMGADSCTPR